jgi:hypothetical protein
MRDTLPPCQQSARILNKRDIARGRLNISAIVLHQPMELATKEDYCCMCVSDDREQFAILQRTKKQVVLTWGDRFCQPVLWLSAF